MQPAEARPGGGCGYHVWASLDAAMVEKIGGARVNSATIIFSIRLARLIKLSCPHIEIRNDDPNVIGDKMQRDRTRDLRFVDCKQITAIHKGHHRKAGG